MRKFFGDDDFDRNFNQAFERQQKLVSRGFKAIVAMWIIGAILFLAFWGTVAWVVLHFVFKAW